MAWYECLYGGGHWNKTVLWTNPSPDSTMGTSTLTLSESYENYDLVGIEYRSHYQEPESSYPNSTATIWLTPEDLIKFQNDGSRPALTLGRRGASSFVNSIRRITSPDYTHIYQELLSSSNNTGAIILNIYGVKL